ncbi:Cytochrome bd-I ubiquinol oxidase subunit 2 [Candidatus Arsenophonus lipoptenae]|uniref:Cytochrome bd-I ubiquinol oxidase subunit 2 n=1 Tax=Candidatus Arsenophonus lipoptenae TaxID=634113 RepID=A0A0X8CX64_9GAMM|nr:cytochrome d ubiquinol oxidase subunit II [Candidatus Arsenophonus lipoptenae]AMA64602.1 Cytochrome bd-I ubiquinol oxidase subunit 2 [Candidatus Arsenophonus lipoptenae]
MFNYEVMRFIWWSIIGLLIIIFAITDGFDMGVGILLPFIGKTNIERRIMINAIAPHWDGNQVWLVTAVGALFAAWPIVYAAALSGFYIIIILILSSLFFRPVGFDYRSKLDNLKWRKIWDYGIFIGSFTPPLLGGIIFGNLLQGISFTINNQFFINYTGSILNILNPYSILIGIISIIVIITHGATYLQMRTTEELYTRTCNITYITAVCTSISFFIAIWWLIYGIDGYVIKSIINTNGVSNPLHKIVIRESFAWLTNFYKNPVLLILPILALIFPIFIIFMTKINKSGLAFLFSSLTISCIILTFGVSMFPFILPSSIQFNASLTVWDATASLLTLKVMTVIVIIFMPIILTYTIWCYRKMFSKIDKIQIQNNSHSLY